jgi:hypothetical protein
MRLTWTRFFYATTTIILGIRKIMAFWKSPWPHGGKPKDVAPLIYEAFTRGRIGPSNKLWPTRSRWTPIWLSHTFINTVGYGSSSTTFIFKTRSKTQLCGTSRLVVNTGWPQHITPISLGPRLQTGTSWWAWVTPKIKFLRGWLSAIGFGRPAALSGEGGTIVVFSTLQANPRVGD